MDVDTSENSVALRPSSVAPLPDPWLLLALFPIILGGHFFAGMLTPSWRAVTPLALGVLFGEQVLLACWILFLSPTTHRLRLGVAVVAGCLFAAYCGGIIAAIPDEKQAMLTLILLYPALATCTAASLGLLRLLSGRVLIWRRQAPGKLQFRLSGLMALTAWIGLVVASARWAMLVSPQGALILRQSVAVACMAAVTSTILGAAWLGAIQTRVSGLFLRFVLMIFVGFHLLLIEGAEGWRGAKLPAGPITVFNAAALSIILAGARQLSQLGYLVVARRGGRRRKRLGSRQS